MCQFVSWVETGKKVYFLTGKQIFDSPKGKALQEWCGSPDDYIGHGAIRWFYELEEHDGTNEECTDFSTPKNFPDAIARAIKQGAMRGLANPEGLLTEQAIAERDKACEQAKAEYTKVCQQAWIELEKVTEPAWIEYDKVREQHEQALAEYEKACEPARIELEKVRGPARIELEKVRGLAFWDLFAIKENRALAWL